MKILLTGSEGQLGGELIDQADRFNHQLLNFTYETLDIADEKQVEDVVRDLKPDAIVNAAAYTFVDQAETDNDEAFLANRDGAEVLAKTCARAHIPMVHISTDYVFDGTSKVPYVETDPVSPINTYGETKEAGERAVRSHLEAHIILRTSWLYGVYGQNFVKTMLRLGKEKPGIQVVSDQYGCPTCAADLAETIFHIISRLEGPVWGTYHYCNRGVISWYQFAEKIFDIVKGLDNGNVPSLTPVPTEAYPTAAKRPVYSALNCDKITARFDLKLKPWDVSLRTTVQRIMSRPS